MMQHLEKNYKGIQEFFSLPPTRHPTDPAGQFIRNHNLILLQVNFACQFSTAHRFGQNCSSQSNEGKPQCGSKILSGRCSGSERVDYRSVTAQT